MPSLLPDTPKPDERRLPAAWGGSGLRVSGFLGFLGFWVLGSGFRVLGLRVQGLGFWVLGFGV